MALGTAPAADTSPELADSPTAVARRRDRRIEGSRRVAIVVEQSPISHLNMAKLNGVLGFIREHRAWQTRLFEVDVRREDLVRWKPDGVMIARDLPMPDLRVGDRAVPVVYFYDEPAHLDGYSVSQDEEHIGALAAGYFLDRGYGHFAYVGLPHRSFSQARGAAFLAALRRRGHDAAVVDLPRPKRDNRYSPPKALLKLPTPLAIFAANDNVALAVMELSHRRGRNVPQQWAVLGVDDITLLCEFSDPPLSSIIHPQVRVGRVAAEMLQTLMRGDTPPDAHLRIASPGVQPRRQHTRVRRRGGAQHALPLVRGDLERRRQRLAEGVREHLARFGPAVAVRVGRGQQFGGGPLVRLNRGGVRGRVRGFAGRVGVGFGGGVRVGAQAEVVEQPGEVRQHGRLPAQREQFGPAAGRGAGQRGPAEAGRGRRRHGCVEVPQRVQPVRRRPQVVGGRVRGRPGRRDPPRPRGRQRVPGRRCRQEGGEQQRGEHRAAGGVGASSNGTAERGRGRPGSPRRRPAGPPLTRRTGRRPGRRTRTVRGRPAARRHRRSSAARGRGGER